jgi:hypothetical protein
LQQEHRKHQQHGAGMHIGSPEHEEQPNTQEEQQLNGKRK